jgi:antitoxin ParD1/3/4
MNVSLTPELEHWVNEKVRSGRYTSASEVIREALRLLEEHELIKQKHLTEIREKIDRGLQQLSEGKGMSAEEARSRIRRANRT